MKNDVLDSNITEAVEYSHLKHRISAMRIAFQILIKAMIKGSELLMEADQAGIKGSSRDQGVRVVDVIYDCYPRIFRLNYGFLPLLTHVAGTGSKTVFNNHGRFNNTDPLNRFQ